MATVRFVPECALCREPLDEKDVSSFFAVSACHPVPGRAEWINKTLRIGRVAGIVSYKPSGLYLLHPTCVSIVKPFGCTTKSYFDCVRALEPILHEESPAQSRIWHWIQSSRDYAPALHASISGEVDNMDALGRKVLLRLIVFNAAIERLPVELMDMILDYVPLELALTMGHLSKSKHWTSRLLNRLRSDPIASRLERAYQHLSYRLEEAPYEKQVRVIRLESTMLARFVQCGGLWYLQGLSPNTAQEIVTKEEKWRQIPFKHNRGRVPYIAVQVNEFGITHIAFELKTGRPDWISPNPPAKRSEFFQDWNGTKEYDSVTVISNGLKLCAVDIPSNCTFERARAIFPHMQGRSPRLWSLSHADVLYVRPTIFNITRTTGIYIWEPTRPGKRGFRVANTPQQPLRELNFRTENARTAEVIYLRDQPESAYVRFPEENNAPPIVVSSDVVVEKVSDVMGIWQSDWACNLIIETS